MSEGNVAPSGDLSMRVIRASDAREIRDRFDALTALSSYPGKELTLAEIAHYGLPRKGLDRSVFTAVALANGDSLQSTYDFTMTAGS